MNNRVTLAKEYERDLSLIIEELWVKGLYTSVKKLNSELPYPPFIIFYATNENLQIWEHVKAFEWYKTLLLEENKKGTEFIKNIISEYKSILTEAEKYLQAGPTRDKKALEQFKKLTENAFTLFPIWYYSATNEATPKDVRDLALALRTSDEFFAKADSFLKNCVELLGCNRDYANLIFPEEFPNLPSLPELEKRAEGVVSIDNEKRFLMPLEQFCIEHPEYSFQEISVPNNIQEIRGQVAFRGIVNGKVKIVKNIKQMFEVEAGNIIISPMTTPDFLPAMQKAFAFVTDEGGITCHAAIVARELKKPCIIGTKIATKVFRDGDMVEVDADNGIVRLLP